MAFCISTRDLPRIHDYQDAQREFNDIKPIRGKEHIRPLGRRSDHNKRIECNTDKNGKPYYAAILHNTEVVSYYEDGAIRIKTGGWSSMSTAEFIGAVSPWQCRRQHNFVCVRVGGGNYVVRDEGLLIKDGIVLNPVPLATKTDIRAETKRIRALAKPVLDYFRMMRKVIGEESLLRVCSEVRHERREVVSREYVSLKRMWTTDCMNDPQWLSDVFAWHSGHLGLDYLYRSALEADITTHDKLYTTTPLPPGTIKKGMFILKETA